MYQDKIYQANKGVAMGSPISSTIAEIFIQHFENTYIKHKLDDKNCPILDKLVAVYNKDIKNISAI